MSDAGQAIINRFDHATVVVRDIEDATVRYAKLLGKPATWRGHHPELATRASLFGLKNGLIELVGPAEGDERAEGLRGLVEQRGEGLHAIAFGTDNAAACATELRSRGLKAAPPEAGEAEPDGGGDARSYRVVELSPRSTRGLSVLAVERDDVSDLQATHAPLSGAVEALDHVVIRTADPEAAVALYGAGLGIRLALDRDFRGTRMLFFRVGGVTIEVVEGGAAVADADGFGGLALRVGDIEAAHARLGDEGFALNGIRDGNKPGTQVFTVKDGTCGVPTLIIRDPARD
ncbi:MAG: VOC family protein [Myxococcales bacterium]|nr:VOC family protein [Myxococcales bacterium]